MVFDSSGDLAPGKRSGKLGANRLNYISDGGNPQTEEVNDSHATGKLRVLVFIDWFLPGYKAGGPIRSVASLMTYLKDEAEFHVITTDRDLGDDQPYRGIASDTWTQLESHVKVYYCSPSNRSYSKLLAVARQVECDVVYLNSFFSRNFSIYPLLFRKRGRIKKPFVLAPRGMLGKGALGLKRGKKRSFLLVAKMMGLHKGITWHSTSAPETAEIKAVAGRGARIVLAPNFPSVVRAGANTVAKTPGALRLFFLSRIAKKKNLAFALQVLSRVRSRVNFDIYGPLEEQGYWDECKKLIAELPANVTASYKGDLPYVKVAETLVNYHCHFLPTLNENFGHVIFESLSAGCPVLISDQTPWKNLAKQKAGKELPLSKADAFVDEIERMAAMDQASFREMQDGAKAVAEKYLEGLSEWKKAYRKLFTVS